ncbi:MAG: DNA/RNA non-specific endonuclease [Lachnospiraceae bacterium]
MNEKKYRAGLKRGLMILLASILLATGSSASLPVQEPVTQVYAQTSIPSYSGKIYTVLNKNVPNFTSAQKKSTEAFETYSKLDSLGRCGAAFANICEELMPTEDRESISSVHPTGWHSNMGWERCHLIGFQLAGENANEKNLITGTNDFNVSGMLPFENMVADYVLETGNHVLYRVTPLFKDKELVARGVEMEAYSVEDNGEGICFHVFVHNVQDGVTINYKTGVVSTPATSQKIRVSVSSKTYKASALSSAKKTFSLGVKTSSGKFTCSKSSGSSCLSVSSSGKVTVKKGTKKGTYTIKVKIVAPKTTKYKKTQATKTIKVKVTGSSSGSSGSGTVYWVPNGEVYHTNRNCSYLSRSKTVLSGTIAESGKPRKCSRCP